MYFGVCDKLHKLYSVGSGPLVQLRSPDSTPSTLWAPLEELPHQQSLWEPGQDVLEQGVVPHSPRVLPPAMPL